MKAIKIGKAGQNHYQQRHNGKNDNANHRQGKQGNMEFFVKKGREILPEAVDMLSIFRFFLQCAAAGACRTDGGPRTAAAAAAGCAAGAARTDAGSFYNRRTARSVMD